MNNTILFYIFPKGYAIECYMCDSTINEKCANLTDKSIKPEVSENCSILIKIYNFFKWNFPENVDQLLKKNLKILIETDFRYF